MSAHTPGPWRIGTINYADIYEPGGDVVALAIKDLDGTAANARLIAAAPELLEALKVVSSDQWVDLSVTDQDNWLRKSAASIAKAEGK